MLLVVSKKCTCGLKHDQPAQRTMFKGVVDGFSCFVDPSWCKLSWGSNCADDFCGARPLANVFRAWQQVPAWPPPLANPAISFVTPKPTPALLMLIVRSVRKKRYSCTWDCFLGLEGFVHSNLSPQIGSQLR